ncbi:B-box domain protein 30-like [Arachis duranensis]|uniref:B-box domain protein 30 n=1 Tax=Arachis duranensis TaxID=130453 RepID=A0A6P4BDG7_ARADU|nr:B-box domain protein 30 [Arachis duranensis]XP_052109295.1 B-box domain protein 30-like [Arachis duranensis]
MCKGPQGKGHASTRGIASSSSTCCCELCGLRASLYCHADDAYLCRKCDSWVHEANFLALRHIRCFLCNTCSNLTRRCVIGASSEVILPVNVSWANGNLPNNSTNTTTTCSRIMHDNNDDGDDDIALSLSL